MATVRMTKEARSQHHKLPHPIAARVDEIAERLKSWPAVSGVKALSGDLAGWYRVRTGDYRIRFYVITSKVQGEEEGGEDETTEYDIVIDKIGHRRDIYDT